MLDAAYGFRIATETARVDDAVAPRDGKYTSCLLSRISQVVGICRILADDPATGARVIELKFKHSDRHRSGIGGSGRPHDECYRNSERDHSPRPTRPQ